MDQVVRLFLRLKHLRHKKNIMPSQPIGKPLVAENDKERCSATTKEMTRCQLAKTAGAHFCSVHATKVVTKVVVQPVRKMVTRSSAK